MTIDAEKNAVASSEKVKQKRPDGTDADRYKNLSNWTYRKWAWEFLRRNPDFIAACEKVEAGTEAKKRSVAQEFGLIKFKHYKERYKGGSGSPKFSMGAISSWTNLDLDKDKAPHVSIRIGAGQMVIRFDLASTIKDKKSLEKQLCIAGKRLNARLVAYEKLIKEEAKVHKHKPVNFGIYIRLLDYLVSGKKDFECAALIHPESVKNGLTKEEMRDLVKDQIKSANTYANENYVYLSLFNGKPKSQKKITLKR